MYYFKFKRLPIEVTIEWYCEELGQSFLPGKRLLLSTDLYKRYRKLNEYFRRPMVRCETPSGRVYWAAVNFCGKLLVGPKWPVKRLEEPIPRADEVVQIPAPYRDIPAAVKPCGCRKKA